MKAMVNVIVALAALCIPLGAVLSIVLKNDNWLTLSFAAFILFMAG